MVEKIKKTQKRVEARMKLSENEFLKISDKISNQIFYYTRCITPKRVMSWRCPFSHYCVHATYLLSKKYRSGGEPLATLCPI